jgi:hypothetical protein
MRKKQTSPFHVSPRLIKPGVRLHFSLRLHSFLLTFFFCVAQQPLGGLGRLIVVVFEITHTSTTTLVRTPLDEGSARRRDLYLTTHNTHKRQTSMPEAEFEPTILVSERPQTHTLDRAATGMGNGL